MFYIAPNQWLLLLLLFIPLLIQWIYYYGYFSVLFSKPKSAKTENKDGVSIIICAKNEAENLKELIPILCAQNHPKFEVIVINDGSWDDSHQLLEAFKKEYPQLKTNYMDPEKKLFSGKKLGLTLGIKAAIYPNILLTDADCRPISENWLSMMTEKLSAKTPMVLGYSPYIRKKGLLNLFIRFETQIAAMQYLSAAVRGRAYMGVGRNLAYTKDAFFEVKGFANHHHIAAGDDDLHVQNMAKMHKAAIVINKEGFAKSFPKANWDEYVKQKRRHLQVGKFYTPSAKMFTGLFVISHLWFSIAWILLLIFQIALWKELLLILFVKWIVNGISFAIGAKRLKDTSTAIFYPILNFLLQIYWLGFGTYVFFTKKREW